MDQPSVLAVVAHPDDESFALGALLAEASAVGSRVGVLCLTHGEASSLHGVEGDLHRLRADELDAAARELGACWVRLLDHPDGSLASAGNNLSDAVDAAVRAFSPDLLLTFDTNGVTGHPDHVAAAVATLAVGRRLDLPVLVWSLPESVAAVLAAEGFRGFVGRPDAQMTQVVMVDRGAQGRAARQHRSQAVPGSALWRRLELLGDREYLRQLHVPPRPTRLPFRVDPADRVAGLTAQAGLPAR